MGEGTLAVMDRRGAVVSALRVALDLSGSLEPLGNSMNDLAHALRERAVVEVSTFRTQSAAGELDHRIFLRRLWRPGWQRSRGLPLDVLIKNVDVFHFAGLATPPSRHVPVMVSVDDLRPLRDETRDVYRHQQLRRAVDSGARLVATSESARWEIQQLLSIEHDDVDVSFPAVALPVAMSEGRNLVVNVTGRTEQLLVLRTPLERLAERRGSELVIVASTQARARLRSAGIRATLRPRTEAAAVLRDARLLVHLSDGARFPSFSISALGGGVPVVATDTRTNREILHGAAVLCTSDDAEHFGAEVASLWDDEARRAIHIAAGRARANDFVPAVAAAGYESLYRSVRQRWERRQ